MYHELFAVPASGLFFLTSTKTSPRLLRKQGCPCGGRCTAQLSSAAARWCPISSPKDYGYRLSFCCDRDGCRKRATPPSVRFLGRKVYLGAVVVLVAAMRQGPRPDGSGSCRSCSKSTAVPSLAGECSGASTFRRRRFGK